ncbi:hypothetical protein HNP73_000513 [Amaricoccus macauensis]|uniref:HTH merR-type domain-containing protein n=1 Tax=Amaricoccus macauensis TaxID=57001 RepID=A0A840SMM4_9RHOB|nr:hypothetical protein [Amaricoccus macauensis]MBB5220592.1 hypothetical protein [Amaricoccus macauensis]
MFDPEKHVLSPMEVSQISDVHADMLRDWRYRGLIEVYGRVQPNGRWSYSLREAVAFHFAWQLITDARVDRASALRLGYNVAPNLITALRGDGPWKKFYAMVYAREANGLHGWSVWESDDLRELEGYAVMVDNLVNVGAFAAAAPRELREAVEA